MWESGNEVGCIQSAENKESYLVCSSTPSFCHVRYMKLGWILGMRLVYISICTYIYISNILMSSMQPCWNTACVTPLLPTGISCICWTLTSKKSRSWSGRLIAASTMSPPPPPSVRTPALMWVVFRLGSPPPLFFLPSLHLSSPTILPSGPFLACHIYLN